MRTRLVIPIAVLAVGAAVAASSCGGGASGTTATQRTVATKPVRDKPAPAHKRAEHAHGARPDRPSHREQSDHAAVKSAVSQTPTARLDPAERRVAAVVRRYIDTLDRHDGETVCSLFVPGALDDVRLPRDRGECGPSLTASIGYRDPRGFPVYRGSRVARIRSVNIDGSSARAVATTVTRFAGNREPSIEDDVVYLESRGGRWLIAKPSAALYRAIGVGNIPPTVLAPPQ